MKKPEGELGTRSEWWRSGYLLPLLVAIVLTVMLLVMRLAPWWSRPTDAWRVPRCSHHLGSGIRRTAGLVAIGS